MSRSSQLYLLQQIDSQLDQAKKRLGEIAKLLSDNTNLKKAEIKMVKAEGVHDTVRKLLNTAEANTKAQRLKIEQTETRLYSGNIKNPKELQDLQNESAALKRHLDTLEERQLEAMMVFEEAETEYQASAGFVDQVKAQLIENNASLSGEQTQILENASTLEANRVNTVKTISEEDLEIYERTRLKSRGIAVAKTEGQSCGACGTDLSSSLYQAARSPATLSTCDTCKRILFVG